MYEMDSLILSASNDDEKSDDDLRESAPKISKQLSKPSTVYQMTELDAEPIARRSSNLSAPQSETPPPFIADGHDGMDSKVRKRSSVLAIPLRHVKLEQKGYRKTKISKWKPTKTIPVPFKGNHFGYRTPPPREDLRSKSSMHHNEMMEEFMFDSKWDRQHRFKKICQCPTVNNSKAFKYFYAA